MLGGMRVVRIIPDLSVSDIAATETFYSDFLGLTRQDMGRGYDIVHPLTTEDWGVRKFFVRDPDGHVLNILQHRE